MAPTTLTDDEIRSELLVPSPRLSSTDTDSGDDTTDSSDSSDAETDADSSDAGDDADTTDA